MRSIVDLLGYLRSQNVMVSLDGGRLKCSAPQGVLTPELRKELSERKPEIVAFLSSARQPGPHAEPAIERIDRSAPLPLSYAQQRLWFLNQMDPASPVYNIGLPMRMQGPLNVPAVEQALRAIIERHESLRTGFIQVDGEPRAVIGDANGWKLKVLDARHLQDDGPGSSLFELAEQQSRESFDITRGPLFRASLLIVGPEHHLLMLTVHHIVSDGWSFGVLAKEFEEFYEGYAAGREPSPAPLTIQYVDYAAWQRKWLDSGELDRQLGYWKTQLAGVPAVLRFPPDHRARVGEVAPGRRSKLVVSRETVASLERLSQRHGVTLFMTLLAAFDVLLARYTGQDDIVLGTPSAGRSRAELSPLIGFFVNNLVLRSDLSGNPEFSDLLGRVRDVTLRAYEHQNVPFDRLVQALRPERTLDHSPLFQVMFALQNFMLEDLNLTGITTSPVELGIDNARFDLTVEVFPKHGELWAYFDYNSDLYEPETIARIERHYVAILESVCADPSQKIGSISLLDAAERQKLLTEWNRTDTAIPGWCFHESFEEHARQTPDRVAVIADGTSVTYRELNHRAGRIAASLRTRGAGPGKLVALCVERSPDLVGGMLGIAKSGAAYIPLDPAYPAGRIANIFEDAEPLVTVTTRNLLPLLPEGVVTLCLDDPDALPDGISEAAEAEHAGGAGLDDLAYVIFTSGSTGRPKGVEIPHRALVNFLESMQKEPGLSAEDVLLAVTTPSFDIAALELLLPLYSGATVAIALAPGDPGALLADLNRYRPTVMQATPATWKLLIAAGWRGDPELKVLCGGEAIDTGLARSLLVRSKSLWNMYGPTETTIWSAVLKIEGAGESAIPVGRPIANTYFYVLDPWGAPAPEGVAGELWIGGDGLARGYLGRPEMTSERFRPDPFSGKAAARMYRTGDLVRYRADGTLDFFGRIDHQVKFRGFRIELGEVEAALRGCSGVRDAVTILRDDDGNQRLVAYLIAANEEERSTAAIRNDLRATLPEYMVPRAFVYLKKFPRLPNGKLNRAALPLPEKPEPAAPVEFDARATTLEKTIAEVFRHLLGVERVGFDDNFFDLGAHSLQIVKVHAELNQRIDSKISLIRFFQYPTIRSLAQFVEQSKENAVSTVSG